MRKVLIAAAMLAVPLVAGAQGVQADGWEARLDFEADIDSVLGFMNMGSGVHVTTTGAGFAIWQPESMVKVGGVAAAGAAAGVMVGEVAAQNRPLSTRGHTATQIGGSYNEEGRYEGGYWIDVHYGRPILRGRRGIFGAGGEYGRRIYAGAPLWRVGADQTTTFTTEADLLIDGQRLNAGEYTVFADLADPGAWVLIFTTWGVKQDFREDDPNALWGAYGYDDSKDVMRTTMAVETVDWSMDQLQIGFLDMTREGGAMYVHWDDQLATVPIELAY